MPFNEGPATTISAAEAAAFITPVSKMAKRAQKASQNNDLDKRELARRGQPRYVGKRKVHSTYRDAQGKWQTVFEDQVTASHVHDSETVLLTGAPKPAVDLSTVSRTPLPRAPDGRTTPAEYERRRLLSLCFYCGHHDAKEVCRSLYKKDAQSAIATAKKAGGSGAVPQAAGHQPASNKAA